MPPSRRGAPIGMRLFVGEGEACNLGNSGNDTEGKKTDLINSSAAIVSHLHWCIRYWCCRRTEGQMLCVRRDGKWYTVAICVHQWSIWARNSGNDLHVTVCKNKWRGTDGNGKGWPDCFCSPRYGDMWAGPLGGSRSVTGSCGCHRGTLYRFALAG